MDGRAQIVAVALKRREAVVVRIDGSRVNRVEAAAVLVDAVARHIGRARMHARAPVVAITLIGGEAIMIGVEVADRPAERDDEVDRRSRCRQAAAGRCLAEDRSRSRDWMHLS